MPIYEYECSLCHHHFDWKQGFDEEPVAVCPQCQGKARRVLRSIPVIFRGSGFYVTDSRPGGTAEKSEEGMPDKDKRKGE